MEVLWIFNSTGKLLLTPMGSRFYLAFLISSWWVQTCKYCQQKSGHKCKCLNIEKYWICACFPNDTWPCSLCTYVSPCNRPEILHKHYHQSCFSEENEHSMSLCLGLYHSLATNRHWAELQNKKIKTQTMIFILEASQNRVSLFCGT